MLLGDHHSPQVYNDGCQFCCNRSIPVKVMKETIEKLVSCRPVVTFKPSALLINPVFAQFETVFFGLFFCLKRSCGGFKSFDFYCLVQVTIKNQASRVPLILRCLNCHSINRIAFISAHGGPPIMAAPLARDSVD